MRVSKHTLVFLALILLLGQPAYTQVVKGSIRDSYSGISLPGVHIIESANNGTLSDGYGFYILKLSNEASSIAFSFIGYITKERTLSVGTDDTLILDIELVPDITAINEIVVSAGKGAQKISDLSVSMSVIKPYRLTKNHIINAEEALHKTSGIEITDGQASIRGGSGYSYGAGSRVLTLIDGLPALSTDAGNIKWGTLPIENISSIEVIKGASSVLYGSSALNGIINFISRDAEREPITRVSMLTGIYDKPPNKEWQWWDKPRMIQNISFNHSAMYGRNSIGIGARLMNDNGYRKLNDEQNARFSLTFNRKGEKDKSLKYGFSLYSSYTDKNDFLLWDNADTGGLIQSTATAMEYRGVSLALDPHISFTDKKSGKHRFVSRYMTNLNRLPENQNNNSDSHSIYAEYQYRYDSWEKIGFIAGFTQQYSFINSNFYGNHRGLNYSLFSQADIRITERLNAVAGVRLEEYILDAVAEQPVPIFRAGLNLKLSSTTFIRASFGQGYRYPSIAEKHAYTTVGAIRIFPNIEIKAEKGLSSELGIRKAINTEFYTGNMDLALFYSKNRNMIEYVFGSYPDPISDEFLLGFRPVNIENSNIYGFEYSFDINRSFSNINTTLSGSYTYVYPVAVSRMTSTGKPEYLKYRRKHSAKLSAELQWNKLVSAVSIYAKSALLDIDDVFLSELTREDFLPGFYDYWQENNKPYATIDLNISYRVGENYTVSFMVRNLGNIEYMGRPGDIQPHRFYSLQVSAAF